jgi:hypothetical protein
MAIIFFYADWGATRFAGRYATGSLFAHTLALAPATQMQARGYGLRPPSASLARPLA